MNNARELIVPADVSRTPEVTSFIENFLDSSGADPSVTMPLVLSAEEAFVNIASYAYPDRTNGKITVVCETTPEGSQVTFSDSGIPFNPLVQPDPDINAGIEARKIGGLGILMIRRFSDEVRYEYREGRNHLTIMRRIRNGE